jgi:hypothetical protein
VLVAVEVVQIDLALCVDLTDRSRGLNPEQALAPADLFAGRHEQEQRTTGVGQQSQPGSAGPPQGVQGKAQRHRSDEQERCAERLDRAVFHHQPVHGGRRQAKQQQAGEDDRSQAEEQ